jgi:hypothetical protein
MVCRCHERLKTKTEGSKSLTHTELHTDHWLTRRDLQRGPIRFGVDGRWGPTTDDRHQGCRIERVGQRYFQNAHEQCIGPTPKTPDPPHSRGNQPVRCPHVDDPGF